MAIGVLRRTGIVFQAVGRQGLLSHATGTGIPGRRGGARWKA